MSWLETTRNHNGFAIHSRKSVVNLYKRIKTHIIAQSNSFFSTTKICVTNRGENMWGISIIFDEYIYCGIVLLNGTTLWTQICNNGGKNHLQTRPTADCVGICSQVRRYFSLFMRHISQVRRFDQPPWGWQDWPVWQKIDESRNIVRYHCMHLTAHLRTYRMSKTLKSWWPNEMEAFSVLLAFVWGVHRTPVNSPYKGQWRGALMFSWNCAWTNFWANNWDAGDLRHHRAYYDVIVMTKGQ